MSKHAYRLVDAFTDVPLAGNPCAVLFDCDAFSDELMLQIAREMNLSETAFLRKSEKADFGVRYFTVSGEIPLAGHPTIATVYALIDTGMLQISNSSTSISLEMGAGVITVEIIAKNNAVQRVIMQQMKPVFLRQYEPEDILALIGLENSDLLPGAPLQTVSTGTPQLMVALQSRDALEKAVLNTDLYTNKSAEFDFFGSPHLFYLPGEFSEATTFARHFLPPPASGEDPFTGSATGGMAAYLWHYNLIKNPVFYADQGHWMGRPGRAWVCIEGNRQSPDCVRVGGSGCVLLRGEINL